MLLPHGFEGQGPEHSSARLERFLQLCAQDNMRVVNVTTAAQLFHLLRRQVHSPNAKPLVVMSPKSGLRARQSRSRVEELVSGSFRETLDDATITDHNLVRRVVLCSGRVSWDAVAARDKAGLGESMSVARVEQLYPWPEAQLEALLGRYPNAHEVVWLQEEPQNSGAWTFVQPRLAALTGRLGRSLSVAARQASGSPATGSHQGHDRELEHLQSVITGGL